MKVQARQCATCIYRKDSPLDITVLEAAIADPRMAGHFTSFRACHHAAGNDVCCAGFWTRHADDFDLGQLSQRLGLVTFVDVDTLKTARERRAAAKRHRPGLHRRASSAIIVPKTKGVDRG